MVFLVVAEMAKHVTFSRTYWWSSESCNDERRQFLTHIECRKIMAQCVKTKPVLNVW